MIRTALLPALAAAALTGAAAKPADPVLGCASPIKRGESAASIKARYPGQAKVEKVDGAEGEQISALVVWGANPAKRIEVLFGDDDPAMRKAVAIRIESDLSTWRSGGIGIGSTLDEVVKANGRAVAVSGFGWDYGGAVDTKNGKLQHLPGGCAIGITMDIGPDVKNPPKGVSGDGVTLASSDPKLKAAHPRVIQYTLFWPGSR